MTLELSSYILPNFSTVAFAVVLIQYSLMYLYNGTVLNVGKRYEDKLIDALALGCAKQSKNLEKYLLDMYANVFAHCKYL